MRILVIGPFAPSLVTFRGDMLAAFVAAGHEVIAAAPDDDGTVGEKLAKFGVRFIPFEFARANASVLGDVSLTHRFVALMREVKPDLYFGYAIKPVVYGTLAAKIAGVPRVASMITGLGHAFLDKSPKGRVIGAIARNLYRTSLCFSNTVFFHNGDDRDFFVREKIALFAERTFVTNGSGVDLNHFAPAPHVTEPMTFLLIARMLREKGVEEFVKASRAVKRTHPNARFQLLGPLDSNPSSLTRAQIDAWVKEGVVEYLGETRDVRPALAASSVFVLPSYHEGTPRSALEAMAMSRPVITTDVPGCRQTTEHGVTGYLVPLKDHRAIAETMVKFLDDPSRVARMGEAARRRALENYDVRAVNAGILRALART